MVEETKLEGDRPVDEINLLDRDLNLYSFRVNQKSKSFEPIGDVHNLASQLQLYANWLEFNHKELIDFQDYKQD